LKNLHGPFLSAMLRSPRLQHEIEDRIHSGSQGKLALHRIAALPIPVPPTQEQHEIVRVVEALFKLADTIEKQVESTTKRAEKITQAILAKAFRGELVPTEAELARRESRSYEPASILLERIKCEDTTNTDTATLVTRPRRRRVLKPHREYRESSG
jgi:type I restriction enzyme S subunit